MRCHDELELKPEPAEARRARCHTRDVLESWSLGELNEVAELVVSELVTNAVAHTTSPARLRLVLEEALLVELIDTSSLPPEVHQALDDEEHGRGLALVDAFAADWGWRPDAGGGKTTWARLDVPALIR